jgi:hypothetical protein
MLLMATQVSQREVLIMGILVVLAAIHYSVIRNR